MVNLRVNFRYYFSDKLFNGQYCLLEFEVPDVIPSKGVECASDDHSSGLEVNLGICLPAGCNLDETKRLVECKLQFHYINGNLHLDFSCGRTRDRRSL